MSADPQDIRTFAGIAILTRATAKSPNRVKRASLVNSSGMTRIEIRQRLDAQMSISWSLDRLGAVLEALCASGALGKSRDGSTYRVRSWERMQEAAR